MARIIPTTVKPLDFMILLFSQLSLNWFQNQETLKWPSKDLGLLTLQSNWKQSLKLKDLISNASTIALWAQLMTQSTKLLAALLLIQESRKMVIISNLQTPLRSKSVCMEINTRTTTLKSSIMTSLNSQKCLLEEFLQTVRILSWLRQISSLIRTLEKYLRSTQTTHADSSLQEQIEWLTPKEKLPQFHMYTTQCLLTSDA